MRGEINQQPEFLTVLDAETLVPQRHPLRGIKKRVDEVLHRLAPLWEKTYTTRGRPSVPPEQLLKAKLLIALFSVRSERMFCEQLAYNLMWQWFLDRSVEEGTFHHSTFSKNAERLFTTDIADAFFAEVYELSKEENWVSNEHFSADGTLIEAWASVKSFRPRQGQDSTNTNDEDGDGNADGNGFKPSNPEVTFKGEKRNNQTHCSYTDPDSVLYRKGKYKEAKLSYGLSTLMENRNGLLSAITVHHPIDEQECDVALRQLKELTDKRRATPKSVGGDKGYHTKRFVNGCLERSIKPHVAIVKGRPTPPGLDKRTTLKGAYQCSQRIRKRIEEPFGWLKTVAGYRKSRYRGTEKNQREASFLGATFNLIRMANLELQQT